MEMKRASFLVQGSSGWRLVVNVATPEGSTVNGHRTLLVRVCVCVSVSLLNVTENVRLR